MVEHSHTISGKKLELTHVKVHALVEHTHKILVKKLELTHVKVHALVEHTHRNLVSQNVDPRYPTYIQDIHAEFSSLVFQKFFRSKMGFLKVGSNELDYF